MKFKLVENNENVIGYDQLRQYISNVLGKQGLQFTKKLTEDSLKRCFITPSGDYMSCPRLNGSQHVGHGATLMEIQMDVIDEYNIKTDKPLDYYFSLKCNSEETMDYIALPKERLTSKAEYSVYDWIEAFFDRTGYKKSIRIATMSGQQCSYDPMEYKTGEIIMKIRKFYNTGNLEEHLNQDDKDYMLTESFFEQKDKLKNSLTNTN